MKLTTLTKIFSVGFLLFFTLIFAQNDKDRISIQFENAKKIDVLQQIEAVSDYRFYYLPNWIDSLPVSGKYTNASVNTILYDIFKESVINYYITSDKKIVLTSNSYINDNLPDNFFNDNEKETNLPPPVLINQQVLTKHTGSETIRIGKETKGLKQRKYNLSGKVKNAVSKEAIANLVIMESAKNINVVTDVNGAYSIDLPSGENLLTLKALGIEELNKKVIIFSDGTLDFDLIENPELLEEVFIEADKDKNVQQAITGVTQIKVKEIKTIPMVLGERDILKVATTMPGITTAGEGASGYNVRGGKTDQNLILLDGGVIYNPSHFFGFFSALNPFTTGEANIYKGFIPTKYGGRLSSVFDIYTKEANNMEIAGEGAIGPVTSNLMLEIPVIKEKAAIIVGGRATYSDWLLETLDEPSLQNSEASFYDLIFKYDHKINEKNAIHATGYYSDDAFSITSDSIYGYSNRLFTLKWDHVINEKHHGNLLITNSEYQFSIDYDGISNTDFDLNYVVNETQVNLNLFSAISQKHNLEYGFTNKLYNNKPGTLKPAGNESIVEPITIADERAIESAIYLGDNFKISEKLLIEAGLRYSFYAFLGETAQKEYTEGLPKNAGTVTDTLYYDKNEIVKTYGGPEFRASARYFLSPNLSVKASYNSTYQFIHTLSNNTTASPTDTYKLSDINLLPEQANQVSLGLYKNFGGNRYELSLEGYYKESENIVDYKVGAELLMNQNIETETLQGDGKAYGIEFLLKKNQGNLNGWLSYTYSRSLIKFDSDFSEERVNGGEYFPSNYDKPHDLSLILNYKFTKRYSLSSNFIYQSGRPVTYPIGNYEYNGSSYVFYSDRNENRIPDYFRWDIGFNIEGNHKIKKLAHSFWNISVYNVLGRNNPYSVFFVTENGQIKAYQSSIFSVPVPTITYNFKF
jgi:hypothetical protein